MLIHGGDITGFEERYGTIPLDFSVNSNPFGLSPKAEAALHSAAKRACQYPDPLYRRLRLAIAKHEALSPEWIFCGNGAADLIWRIVYAVRPRHALLMAPTFLEYDKALTCVHCHVEHYLLREREDFQPGEDFLDRITEKTDILFLCHPNNPTGLLTEQGLLIRILEQCREKHVLLVVDECFLGFLAQAERLTLKSYLSAYPNLLILKAFTKLYGMAGLRLGYCLGSDPTLLSSLGQTGQCWPISVIAEEAGIAALQDSPFVQKTLSFLAPERERVACALKKLDMRVWPGQANYLFFRTKLPHFQHRLAEKGILIRNCGNYPGLDDSYCRIAILTPPDNDRLLTAIKEVAEEASIKRNI
ncbi:MAG: aminotransferase class I/II-fold pyridoxal phosphate-dependent enzyme [Lachnospiraceae bacterium]|nr:aminotransferase class I/II-fold pyridoxal phosphate-dependent enzyme [Lachnospiraceae bacterium]